LSNKDFYEIEVATKQNIKNAMLDFYADSTSIFYGVSLESDSGLVLDNFSFRGNSGLALTKVKSSMYKSFNEYLDYNLVVLQYGLNVLSEMQTDYSWYERSFTKTVSYIKNCFPNAAILLVGVSDRSYRNEDGNFETIPSLENLLEVQENCARKNKVAFLNLYKAMGGKNTMVKWVENEYPLANKDYTHLNFRGSQKIGRIIFNHIKAKYSEWEKSQTAF
jgi:lysophospholipase L1-like esterase